MWQVRSEPGFDVLPDGSIIARYGVQSNCAGIVQIQFRIKVIDRVGIQFIVLGTKDELVDLWVNPFISGANMPEEFQNAVLAGVTEGFEVSSMSRGIKFTLISAFVHPIDGNEFMFKFLGRMSFFAWYVHREIPDKISWSTQ